MTKKKSPFPWIAGILLMLSLGLVLWPFFRPGFFITDDGEWMVIRLSAFYQSLASGQFPVRFLGRLNNSYGYPVANFLYPGFLYIGSVLHVIGISFVDAVKVILGVSVAGGAAATFMTLRSRFKMVPSILGTMSFIFSPYLLYDVYRRGSVGELLGIFAAAIALLALSKGWVWLMAPSIAFLIVSHNTVALIAGLGIAVLIFLHQKRLAMIISAAWGVGMAAFFWLPALLEKRFVRFDATIVSNPSFYFVNVENAALLGAGVIVALAVILGLRKKLAGQDKIITILAVTGIVLSVAISAPLWSMPLLGKLVQFPYRFLVLTVLFGPWVVALAVEHVRGWQQKLLGVILLVIFSHGLIMQLGDVRFVERPEGYYTTNEATTNVANEYMPLWVTDIPLSRPVETLEVIEGDVKIIHRTFLGEYMKVDIDAKKDSVVQINKIYYPGWGITLDNKLMRINYQNPLGVMRVEVPAGVHTLVATFRETPMRLFSDIVSLVCVIGYLIFVKRLKPRVT